jgi:hypothetical protein
MVEFVPGVAAVLRNSGHERTGVRPMRPRRHSTNSTPPWRDSSVGCCHRRRGFLPWAIRPCPVEVRIVPSTHFDPSAPVLTPSGLRLPMSLKWPRFGYPLTPAHPHLSIRPRNRTMRGLCDRDFQLSPPKTRGTRTVQPNPVLSGSQSFLTGHCSATAPCNYYVIQ